MTTHKFDLRHIEEPTLTDQKIIGEMEKFLADPKTTGIAFVLAMKDEKGRIALHTRQSQPCWGELRVYHPGEYRPSDLRAPFPDGTPIGVGIKSKITNDWAFAGDLAPHRGVGKRSIKVDKGFILLDTKINSDLFVNYIFSMTGELYKNVTFVPRDTEPEKLAAFIMSCFVVPSTNGNGDFFTSQSMASRWIRNIFTLDRLVKGTPRSPDDLIFHDRGSYRRPVIHEIWEDDNYKTLQQYLGVTGKPHGYGGITLSKGDYIEAHSNLVKGIEKCLS